MTKKLPSKFLVLLLSLLFYNNIFAQSDRVDKNVKKQIVELNSVSVTSPSSPNIPENTAAKLTLAPNNKIDSLATQRAASENKIIISKQDNNSNFKKSKQTQTPRVTSNDVSIAHDNNPDLHLPIYPDFKVIATKEEAYETSTVLKERVSEQLVNVRQPVAEDNISEKRITNTTDKITISPLKRKYLEEVAADLEKEIQVNPNSNNIDIISKKKELEDLKKLLAQ